VRSERHIDLAIQSVNSDGQGRRAAVRIRDNGCGIPEDRTSRIFNPFYTSKANGTGLGLGVAKKVLDAHRGTISVSSRVGEGSEFVVSIPLADSARDFSRDGNANSVNQPGLNSSASSGNGSASVRQ
jgi:signal transduction histidine kinase